MTRIERLEMEVERLRGGLRAHQELLQRILVEVGMLDDLPKDEEPDSGDVPTVGGEVLRVNTVLRTKAMVPEYFLVVQVQKSAPVELMNLTYRAMQVVQDWDPGAWEISSADAFLFSRYPFTAHGRRIRLGDRIRQSPEHPWLVVEQINFEQRTLRAGSGTDAISLTSEAFKSQAWECQDRT